MIIAIKESRKSNIMSLYVKLIQKRKKNKKFWKKKSKAGGRLEKRRRKTGKRKNKMQIKGKSNLMTK